MRAALNGHVEIVRVLLEFRADVNLQNKVSGCWRYQQSTECPRYSTNRGGDFRMDGLL
jgi:ankyrin repeat protein